MEELEKLKNPASQSQQETGQHTDNGEDETRYTLRHNKADVTLTLGELLKTAEKGLDYDRIRPSHEFVKKLAEKKGESDIARYLAKMREELSDAAAVAEPAHGRAENETEVIAREYPQFVKNGALELPEAARRMVADGVAPLEACRAADLQETKAFCARLESKLAALEEGRVNAAASIGSLSGGEAPEKDYYTAKEWDRLPGKQKEKFIKNGKIYAFMRKWNAE
jgi:hypothetical protein